MYLFDMGLFKFSISLWVVFNSLCLSRTCSFHVSYLYTGIQLCIVLLYNPFYLCKIGSNVPSFSLILVIWVSFPLFFVNFFFGFVDLLKWFTFGFIGLLYSILYFINFCSNIYYFLPSICHRFTFFSLVS